MSSPRQEARYGAFNARRNSTSGLLCLCVPKWDIRLRPIGKPQSQETPVEISDHVITNGEASKHSP